MWLMANGFVPTDQESCRLIAIAVHDPRCQKGQM